MDRVTLHLRDVGKDAPAEVRLRRALKTLLRSFGWRCTGVDAHLWDSGDQFVNGSLVRIKIELDLGASQWRLEVFVDYGDGDGLLQRDLWLADYNAVSVPQPPANNSDWSAEEQATGDDLLTVALVSTSDGSRDQSLPLPAQRWRRGGWRR
jgi:hypothetical protein